MSLGWPRLTRSEGSGAGRGPAKGLPARRRSMLGAAGQPLTGAFEVQPLIIFISIHIFLYIYVYFFSCGCWRLKRAFPLLRAAASSPEITFFWSFTKGRQPVDLL